MKAGLASPREPSDPLRLASLVAAGAMRSIRRRFDLFFRCVQEDAPATKNVRHSDSCDVCGLTRRICGEAHL